MSTQLLGLSAMAAFVYPRQTSKANHLHPTDFWLHHSQDPFGAVHAGFAGIGAADAWRLLCTSFPDPKPPCLQSLCHA